MEKFLPIGEDRPKLPIRVAERLRTQVADGELAPGERLLPERELAERLGVSRAVLREAVGILAAAGLLDVQHGRGTFVAKSDPNGSLAAALSPPASAVVATRELIDLIGVRLIVEPEAAAIAAEAMGRRELAALRAQCQRADTVLAARVPDLDAVARLNTELHATIARASGNAVLARVVEDLMRLLAELRRKNLRVPGRVADSWCEHRHIVDALESRDAAEARRLMREHVEHSMAPPKPHRGRATGR